MLERVFSLSNVNTNWRVVMKLYKKSLAYIIFAFVSVFAYTPNTVLADSAQNNPVNLNIDVNNNVGAQVVGGGDSLNVVGVGAVVSVALGDSNTAVATGIQINCGSNGTAQNSNAGAGSVVDGVGNNAVGAWTKAIGYGNTAIGAYATSSGLIGGTAIGAYSQALANGSVALGAGSVADRPDTVSVGRSSATGQEYDRQITNVAPGYYDTDAVNMSQLRGVDNKVDRVGSVAMAMSGLAPLAYDPKDPTQYSAAYGTYNGTGAVALGVFHYTKPSVMYNAAVAMSNDKWEKSARFGVTWRTGGSKPKAIAPMVETKSQEEGTFESKIRKILAESNTAE